LTTGHAPSSDGATDAPHRLAHPIVFLLLILPFGSAGGYLSVALAYTLSQAGMSTPQIGALIALYLAPQAWKFLWAPIVDMTLSHKSWYLLGAAGCILGTLAMGVWAKNPDHLLALDAVVLLASLASTVLGMSVESLMAHATAPEQKGRAAGWFQAGNLGGNGLGGGAALWLSQHVAAPWVAAAALSVSYALCCLALFFVSEPRVLRVARGISRRLSAVLQDLWQVARSRTGYMALFIVFLPIGTGAASNLWSATADDWHASAPIVALVNGALGGLVSAIGCIVGGYLCDRFDRKFSYVGYGVLQALCAVAMALGPRTETAYVEFTIIYAFTSGLTYAGFSAVTLDAMGRGAAATKYNVFASLSNMPIAYMTLVEGWAYAKWSAAGMLYVEAALGVASMALFCAAATWSRRRATPALA
jgi:MFS transporter, PAT family, beta-lactamase induction signal transducer AmpG